MRFDLNISNQSEILEDKIKASFYQKLNAASKVTGFMRLTGIGVGVVSGLLTISKRIALIAENIFKGLLNIYGACCLKRGDLKLGMGQLIVVSTMHLAILPFSIFSAVLGMVIKPVKMLVDPVGFTKTCWFNHDPKAEEEHKKHLHLQRLAQEKELFNNLIRVLKHDPNNIVALKALGVAYEKGEGTERSEQIAFDYYKRAAKLGDIESMTMIGTYYQKGAVNVAQNYNKAFEWFNKAAHLNDTTAMTALGLCYEQGWGVQKDDGVSFQWTKKAAEKGEPSAMFQLGLKYSKGHGVDKNFKEAAV